MIEIFETGVTLPEGGRALLERAMSSALAHEGASGDVTILVTTPEEIRRMNREFRNIDRVTDVLTFPAWEGEAVMAPPDGYLGDVAICLERAREQAQDYGHSLERELGFLAVHGGLHLLGYDHMTPEDEAVMFKKQDAILEEMELYR